MPCCDWNTFTESFLDAWRRKGFGEVLIDWKKAKRDWRRFHCTGGEAARMQLVELAKEGAYLWLERFQVKKRRPGDDEGGLPCAGHRPKSPVPL